jgi:hypothetical protein
MGAVSLYVPGSGGWTLQTQLVDVSLEFNGFGAAVALSGSTLAVGAYGRFEGTGKVYLYVQSGGIWGLVNALNAVLGQQFDYFGGAVALAGSSLAIGAPYASYGAGALYAY